MTYLAIGAVTRAIAELLEKKMNKPALMGGITPKVTTLPPDDDRVDDADGVNLFLYKITESPFASNMDWRGDRANPRGNRRPPLAVTLNYLLTAYARPSDMAGREDVTAHQLLGNAMSILHDYPVINDVHDADFDADLDAQFPKELRDSFEKVKVMLQPFSMDEYSKIWTGLNKGYRLSVGYEVSLVNIAPAVPTASGGPSIQQPPTLQVGTLSAPSVASIDPPSGAAGASVTLTGSNFKMRGRSTTVRVGDTQLAEGELTLLTENKIVFNVPEVLQRGPKLDVTVSAGGRESEPVVYTVRPWITTLRPLRGLTGIELTIPFEVPGGATVNVEFDGVAAAAVVVDAADKEVRATVPALASNGPKPVVLILDDGTPHRSNARLYEVLPMVTAVNVTTLGAPPKTTILVTGQRLNGADVHVRYGKLLIRKGANATATQVSVEVDRVLPTNLPVAVIVDGRESNTIPPGLEQVDPPEAFMGDAVTLRGSGLSGQAVVVHFGAAGVNVGAHSYASQLSVKVPAGLAAGVVNVSVSVNGNDTNTLPFRVLG